MPLIRILRIRLRRDLVRMSPVVTGRGLHFDHVGAKIGQDYGGAGTRNEARQVYYFQSRKNILSRHCFSFDISNRSSLIHRPWNSGARFCRNACVPSCLSCVAAQRPKKEASRAKPSVWLVSKPLFTASSEYLTASGAFAKICLRIASARGIRSAARTTSLTSAIR